ncbi:unnamed protein product (macronuclear) [Paramecium tetraurelia]|uniref:Uncharacterized protein n=1 Tax=Paramecium tetraurelia TaxID=5888 RepID=A0C9M7_PARTE|nr:uncharacterized protein GSPATT00006800001 [Paramecium tetraurelia]CAK67494.1 unnamed protein product [Paramecium tetraurelia]|eukprot:XP_001434891.1 hypothetical protein (macronuclear) [Paramecium tetraurelia strain d4-2]
MKYKLLVLFFISLDMAQEWEIIYESFKDSNSKDAIGWTVKNNYNQNLFTSCNGIKLFGGYGVFAQNTLVSKYFSLPPHFKVKVDFDFWKIDSWDNEGVYIFVDDKLWAKGYSWWQGSQICGVGDGWNEVIEPISIIISHNSESLVFIITSSLDQPPSDESWGFRSFTLSILRCPQGCLFCQDTDYNNCFYWISFISLWHYSIEVDGWMKNSDIQPAIGQCASIGLVGGSINLAPNDKLEKIFTNLHPHYKMVLKLQLWKIDSWDNENFVLEVDGQIYNQTILRSAGSYQICGSSGQEQIINIEITLSHHQSECKITMRTNNNSITKNAYWGIRAFNLYLAKCITGCDQCLGPLITQCTECSKEWVIYQNFCTYPPPMLFLQISITQLKVPQLNWIPIQIHLLEVDQKIVSQGNFTLLFKNTQQILTFQVDIKCIPKKAIKSLFYSNSFQNLQQYQYRKNCLGNFNTAIYNVKYDLKIIAEQQLIIHTSDTQCLIYQVVRVADELAYIRILEIFLEDF